ncbi:MAG: hypothetical protein AABN95_17480 [Acidobacteriota bacterium]
MSTQAHKYSKVILKHGFGVRKNQIQENDEPSHAQINKCKQWLKQFARKKSLPTDRCLNSYYLKHVVEDAVGEYVTNGAFIQAAVDLGFKYSSIVGPNAFFHIELRLPEDEWRRIKPTGFSKWLFQQEHFLLAQDAKADPTWPRTARRFIDFWRYLNRHGGRSTSDEEWLSEAWESWSGQMAPQPDLIDTDLVYDQKCDLISLGDQYPLAPPGFVYLYALIVTEKPYDLLRVRYVGQTVSPSKRLREHILRPGSIERVKWVGDLLRNNEYPRMAIFETVLEDTAVQMEMAAIYAFSERETLWDDTLDGFPPLDNALLNIKK